MKYIHLIALLAASFGSDFMGNSSLYTVSGDGIAISNPQGIGGGYFYSALTLSGGEGPPNPVPEPSSWTLAALGSALVGAGSYKRRARA